MYAKANESLSIAQIVGNVASTVLNAAEKRFREQVDLSTHSHMAMTTPRQHGSTGLETKPRKRRKEEETCNHFSLSLSFPKNEDKAKERNLHQKRLLFKANDYLCK